MEIGFHQKNPPAITETPTPVQKYTYSGREITALPRELVEKILANLNGRDLVTCKRVTREWQEIIDSTPMLPRVFCRRLHPLAPAPRSLATVKDYHCSIRHWLECFSEQGRKLVVELDEIALAGARFFPERLFFSLARLLAEAPVFHCHKVCTIQHAGQIYGANFSPDGRYMVTASGDNTAKICGHIDGQWQEITTLTHPDKVLKAYFSPTGTYCATYCSNQTIHIWETREQMVGPWRRQVTLPHCQLLRPHNFSADGHWLVTRPTAYTTQLHQFVNGQWRNQTSPLDYHCVQDVCFHPQEHILATVHDFVNVRIWQLVDNQWEYKITLQHPPDHRSHIHFSPNGNRLCVNTRKFISVGRYQTNVYIYNRAGGIWLKEATIPVADMVDKVRFSPNGDKLVMICSPWEVGAVWSFSDHGWRPVILPQMESFTNGRFSPDGHCLATPTKNNTVIIWREVDQQWQKDATLHYQGDWVGTVMKDILFSPYGHYSVVIPQSQDAKIWGIVNGAWQQKSCQSLGKLLEGSFSPDGLYFFANSWKSHTVNIWTFHHGKP